MADIILPNGEGKTDEPYDQNRDLATFSTKLVNAIREHPHLPPAMVIGALTMIGNDVHHLVVTNQQQTQMAQAALQKMNADRLRRNN